MHSHVVAGPAATSLETTLAAPRAHKQHSGQKLSTTCKQRVLPALKPHHQPNSGEQRARPLRVLPVSERRISAEPATQSSPIMPVHSYRHAACRCNGLASAESRRTPAGWWKARRARAACRRQTERCGHTTPCMALTQPLSCCASLCRCLLPRVCQRRVCLRPCGDFVCALPFTIVCPAVMITDC